MKSAGPNSSTGRNGYHAECSQPRRSRLPSAGLPLAHGPCSRDGIRLHWRRRNHPRTCTSGEDRRQHPSRRARTRAFLAACLDSYSRILWQFEHTRMHLEISKANRGIPHLREASLIPLTFVAGSMWCNSITYAGNVPPQSAQGLPVFCAITQSFTNSRGFTRWGFNRRCDSLCASRCLFRSLYGIVCLNQRPMAACTFQTCRRFPTEPGIG